MYLIKIFKSNYCKAVFLIAFIGSYFLIPANVFVGFHILLSLLFMVTFSLSVACILRNVKDTLVLSKTYKHSILGIIASILGLSALQVCGVAAPICGASIGVGIVSAIFPGALFNYLTEYSMYIIYISILLQLTALYFMNCFKVIKKTE